jgi:hypothetical protein
VGLGGTAEPAASSSSVRTPPAMSSFVEGVIQGDVPPPPAPDPLEILMSAMLESYRVKRPGCFQVYWTQGWK